MTSLNSDLEATKGFHTNYGLISMNTKTMLSQTDELDTKCKELDTKLDSMKVKAQTAISKSSNLYVNSDDTSEANLDLTHT
jgi:phage shock protein A